MEKVSNLWGASLAYYIKEHFEKSNIVILTKDQSQFEKLYEDLKFFFDKQEILPFMEYVIEPFEMVRVLPEIIDKKVETLIKLRKKENNIVIATCYSLFKKLPPQSIFYSSIINIKQRDCLKRDELLYYLDTLGYVNVEVVTDKGEFAFRGDIFEVFPTTFKHPVRIEFFDDEVEQIYFYEIDTFKKLQMLNSVEIPPATELIADIEEIVKSIKDIEVIEKFENFGKFGGYFWYAPYVYEKMDLLTDYFLIKPKIVSTFDDVDETIENFYFHINEKLGDLDKKLLENFATKSEARRLLTEDPIFLGEYLDNPSKIVENKSSALLLHYNKKNIYQAIEDFIAILKDYLKKSYKTVISVANEKFENTLISFLHDHKIEINYINLFNEAVSDKVNIYKNRLSGGFVNDNEKLFIVCDFEIFGFAKRKRKSFSKKDAFKTSITDLETGDYVVHIDYGIGLYKGIVHKELGGIEGDFIELEYADGEILYVPIDGISQVQKYFGAGGQNPRLSSLKSTKWINIKQQARSSAKKIAIDLLKLYAERKALKKPFVFKDDGTYISILENSFEYEETEDQLSAINDVYADMEKDKPMDRLICGDVGFGKTEVAIRAACKAASCGKQVAVICPTTILAKQHYDTFNSRMKELPFKIEYVSRMKTSKEIKHILEELALGKIDIIIGTHRLLSKDVFFKDLGLLIIDEEQRFGVAHKEKILEMRSNIDVLTLTATPIPRTLQMSLSGLRDISIIETPPVDRLPVVTKPISKDDEVKEAIEYELKRGGQVYFLDNNVRHIAETARWLKALVPFARIDIAHGQLASSNVEKSLEKFYAKETDILVCSTIIENGIDIPNANTIIIKNAEQFGLSQLYQLKGRVGRSARRGYCYLFIRNFNNLSKLSKKRIQIIEQLSDLGSGFKISSYDLQLRGAGDILGAEQSGFIVNIGYELYIQLIEEAVNELKGAKQDLINTEVQSSFSYFIPADYIKDPRVRIDYYNRISTILKKSEIDEYYQEFLYLYGTPPEVVENLLWIMLLRNLASKIGVKRVVLFSSKIKLIFDERCTFLDPVYFLNALNGTNLKGIFSGSFEFIISNSDKYVLFSETADLLLKIAEQANIAV